MPHALSRLTLAALIAGTCLASAQAATTPPAGASAPAMAASAAGSLARGDRTFVEKAFQAGMAESTLGRLAVERASNADVKSFGNMMVQDHDQANATLGSLAAARGMAVPNTLDAAHQRDVDRMGQLSGTAFDKAFMAHMVSAHKAAVADFDKASRSLRDPELKDFAKRTLPTLRSHLQTAQATLTQAVHGHGLSTPAGAASR